MSADLMRAFHELLASGDDGTDLDGSGQRYLDRARLKQAIVGHRTFFCPISKRGLDVSTAVAVELADGQLIGPYCLPGIAEKHGMPEELILRGILETAQEIDPEARVLNGRVLFGRPDSENP